MKLIRVTILCRTQEECVKKDFLRMIKIGMAGARDFFSNFFSLENAKSFQKDIAAATF